VQLLSSYKQIIAPTSTTSAFWLTVPEPDRLWKRCKEPFAHSKRGDTCSRPGVPPPKWLLLCAVIGKGNSIANFLNNGDWPPAQFNLKHAVNGRGGSFVTDAHWHGKQRQSSKAIIDEKRTLNSFMKSVLVSVA